MRVCSLFSGCGGLDWGFHNIPFYEVVFANDIDKYACDTYRRNISNNIICGNVEDYLQAIPNHDILLGGFPCQAFSMAGKRKGFDDDFVDKNTGTHLQRGIQYRNIIRILKGYRPIIGIFENVKGLLSHKTGDIKTLDIILEDIKQCSYKVHVELIQMWQYGIPQKRERVIIFAIRDDIKLEPEALIPNIPLVTESLLLRDNLIFGSPTVETNISNHNLHIGNYKGTKLGWIKILKEGENLKDLSQSEIDFRFSNLGIATRIKPKSLLGYRRLDGNKIAPTMMFGNTCLPIHPTEERSISVREAAHLQGFPEKFIFEGGISSQYKQVGNAVPPKFSFILAKHVENIMSNIGENVDSTP